MEFDPNMELFIILQVSNLPQTVLHVLSFGLHSIDLLGSIIFECLNIISELISIIYSSL